MEQNKVQNTAATVRARQRRKKKCCTEMKYCKWGILYKKGVIHTDTGQIWLFKAAASQRGQPPGKKLCFTKVTTRRRCYLWLHFHCTDVSVMETSSVSFSKRGHRPHIANGLLFIKQSFYIQWTQQKEDVSVKPSAFHIASGKRKKNLANDFYYHDQDFKQVHGEATQQ